MTPRCISAVCLVPASCEMQSVKNNKSSFRKAEFDYLTFLLGDAGGLFCLKIDPFWTKTAAKVCSMLLMMKQTFVNSVRLLFWREGATPDMCHRPVGSRFISRPYVEESVENIWKAKVPSKPA